MSVPPPDVVLVADGGGLVRRRPASRRRGEAGGGARLRFQPSGAGGDARHASSSRAVAARVDQGGELDTAISFVVEDGRITRIDVVRNPTSSVTWTGKST